MTTTTVFIIIVLAACIAVAVFLFYRSRKRNIDKTIGTKLDSLSVGALKNLQKEYDNTFHDSTKGSRERHNAESMSRIIKDKIDGKEA